MTIGPAPDCPDCGGRLQLITDGAIGQTIAPSFFVVGVSRLREVWIARPFLACSTCEFCIEVQL